MTNRQHSQAAQTRVMLVDDHPMYRLGLASVVDSTPGFKVVAQAGTREEALACLESADPALAVVDLRMGADSGIEIGEALKRARPTLRVLICSAFLTETEVLLAAQARLDGYLLKTANLKEIRQALHDTVTGGSHWSSRATQVLAQAAQRVALSPREKQVLLLVARGAMDKEIAEVLGLSLHTVVGYFVAIREKLGARNRAEAILIAQQRGLVPIQSP